MPNRNNLTIAYCLRSDCYIFCIVDDRVVLSGLKCECGNPLVDAATLDQDDTQVFSSGWSVRKIRGKTHANKKR